MLFIAALVLGRLVTLQDGAALQAEDPPRPLGSDGGQKVPALEPPARPQEQGDPLSGLWNPIDLELKDVDAEKALEMIFQQGGELWKPPGDVPRKQISLHMKKAPFWQAVDEVCRLHGGIQLSPRPASDQNQLFEFRPWADYPVEYHGPVRIYVYDAARIKELRYPRREDRTEVSLLMHWTSRFLPARTGLQEAGTLRIHHALDDTGKPLLPLVIPSEGFHFFPESGTGTPSCEWLFSLQPAADNAKTIASLEGEWAGSILSDLEELTFAQPAQSVGTSQKAGPFTVTLAMLEKIKTVENTLVLYRYRIRIAYDEESASEPLKSSLKIVPLSDRLIPDGRILWARRAESRQILSPTKAEGNWAEREGTLMDLVRATDFPPKAIIVQVGKSIRPARVKFALKDIKLSGSIR